MSINTNNKEIEIEVGKYNYKKGDLTPTEASNKMDINVKDVMLSDVRKKIKEIQLETGMFLVNKFDREAATFILSTDNCALRAKYMVYHKENSEKIIESLGYIRYKQLIRGIATVYGDSFRFFFMNDKEIYIEPKALFDSAFPAIIVKSQEDFPRTVYQFFNCPKDYPEMRGCIEVSCYGLIEEFIQVCRYRDGYDDPNPSFKASDIPGTGQPDVYEWYGKEKPIPFTDY